MSDKPKCENAQPKDYSEFPAHCRSCQQIITWDECPACEGEGGTDGYEEDPLWYRQGELAPCGHCAGAGGWWYHGTPEDSND